MMHPDNVALIPFREPVVLPHVGEKWEGFLRDYAWAMPSARAWQSLETAMSSHSAADAVPSLSRRAE
jgi:hypothetical protein